MYIERKLKWIYTQIFFIPNFNHSLRKARIYIYILYIQFYIHTTLSMSNNAKVILRFDHVSFAYMDGKHIILDDASCTVREGNKITIMGQNGAGKSTMFKMIMGELKPQTGKIVAENDAKIAIARQTIPRDQLELSVREYFATAFEEKEYQLDKKAAEALAEVNLKVPLDKTVRELSGGQQARLLLAYALIQEPDILLLDEPTNNLDSAGIWDLIWFLYGYMNTVIVISHDADFLNLFTDWVLYLNKDRKQIEQYRGDYYDVVEQIQAQIEKEKKNNARMEKKIKDAKDKINEFSHKWGKMRKLAKKMRAEVEAAEENTVEVRKDDKTIAPFTIDAPNLVWDIVTVEKTTLMNSDFEIVTADLNLQIRKKQKYLLEGPNGVWKSTLLRKVVKLYDDHYELPDAGEEELTKEGMLELTAPDGTAVSINPNARLGYYSQDFEALDMTMTVWDSLHSVSNEVTDQEVYRIASRFLLTGEVLKSPVIALSEGQKWLLCYARFVIQKPHLLILDEPTNHINFRHLPVIAEALNQFEWAMVMVCHDQWFLDQLKDVEHIGLERYI